MKTLAEIFGAKRSEILESECANHPVAYCEDCQEAWELYDIVSPEPEWQDARSSGMGLNCPKCGKDLQDEVWQHIDNCRNF